MKKKLWGLVAIILFVLGVGIAKAVTTDTEPPTVSRMSIVNPKDSYAPGERVYLNTDLKDDVSGSIFICCNWKNPTLEQPCI